MSAPPADSVLDVWRNDWGCTNSLFPDTQDGSGGHWEEACLGNELMTPTRNGNAPVNPISALSIAALQDMSYEVDISAAETGSDPDSLTSFPPMPNDCCKDVRRKRKQRRKRKLRGVDNKKNDRLIDLDADSIDNGASTYSDDGHNDTDDYL